MTVSVHRNEMIFTYSCKLKNQFFLRRPGQSSDRLNVKIPVTNKLLCDAMQPELILFAKTCARVYFPIAYRIR
jgi:hypothetical protein